MRMRTDHKRAFLVLEGGAAVLGTKTTEPGTEPRQVNKLVGQVLIDRGWVRRSKGKLTLTIRGQQTLNRIKAEDSSSEGE